MASTEIRFTIYDHDGEEVEHVLPAVFEVCDRCEGHGTHLTPSIGQHAYSREEFDETFHDDEDRAEYFKRGGIYDVPCEECHGQRVAPVVDEERADPVILALYWKKLDEEAADRAERRNEERFGY